MEEAQVVAGIPTLSADPKADSRLETATVTHSSVTEPATKTESRSTSSAPTATGPSIYPRRAQELHLGHEPNTMPHWPFWLADIVLVGGALAVWLLAPRPMTLGTIIFAAALIVIGAIVAVIPWLNTQASRPSAAKPAINSGKQVPPLQRLPFRLK